MARVPLSFPAHQPRPLLLPRSQREGAEPTPAALPTPPTSHSAGDPYAQARRLWGHLILKVGRPRPQEE